MDSFGARDYKVKLSADVRHLQMWKLRGLYWQVSANMHNLACKDNNCLDNNYDERKGILKSVHNYWERCIQAEKQKQLYRFDRNLNYFYTD